MAAIKRVILPSVPGTGALAEGTEVFVEDGSGGLDLYIGNSSNNPVLVSANQFLQSGDVVEVSDIVDNLISTDTNKPLSANQGKVLEDTKSNVSDIVDNLTSTDTDKPLSAKQGEVLNENKPDASEDTFLPVLTTLDTDFSDVQYLWREGRHFQIGKVHVIQIKMATSSVVIGSASGRVIVTGLPYAGEMSGFTGFMYGWNSSKRINTIRAAGGNVFMNDKNIGQGLTVGSLSPSDVNTSTGNFITNLILVGIEP